MRVYQPLRGGYAQLVRVCNYHPRRGGSWRHRSGWSWPPWAARASYRSKLEPFADVEYGGFRCVLDAWRRQ